jgi:hypothetical protein
VLLPRQPASKTAEQLDLQALHRVRERLVSQGTGHIDFSPCMSVTEGIPDAGPPLIVSR